MRDITGCRSRIGWEVGEVRIGGGEAELGCFKTCMIIECVRLKEERYIKSIGVC